jgi:CubicO group peptidase (beta-lactamase class C family)
MSTRRALVAAGAALALGACSRPRAAQPRRSATVSIDAAAPSEWEPSPPDRHGVPAAVLEAVFDAGAETAGLRSLVVVRDGRLVGERYYRGAAAADLLPVNSVTKSVTSMLVAQALERGSLAGLDTPIARLLPEAAAQVPDSPVAQLTLEQVLTGRSGIAYDVFRGNELAESADPVRFALDMPRTPAPASGWSYNDPIVGLLSPVLARAEGRDLAALAERDLFAPLGITRYAWRRDRQGRPLAYGGLALRTRDLAKLAWTMAEGGVWQGHRILSADAVARGTRARGPADWRVPPVEDIGYGELWFKGALGGRRVVWGWGYGGQFALFAPALHLAIATAAISPPPAQLGRQTNAIMALVARIVGAAT